MSRFLLLVSLAALPASGALAGSGDPADYALVVRVTYESTSVPQSLRDEVEFEIARALTEARCFTSVVPAHGAPAAEADLELGVHVAGFEEETRYELGVSDHQSSGLPVEARNAAVTKVGADLTLGLFALPERAAIRERSGREAASHRPVIGEDPAVEARLKLLRNTARAATRFACKGKAKSLAKAIERARLEHEAAPRGER